MKRNIVAISWISIFPALLNAETNPTNNIPPNVVLIFVDDLGYGEVGAYGYKKVPTPHIDAIAENGVLFSSGYVTAPFCAPSRAGLLTGKFQTRFGYEFNPVGVRNENPDVGLPVTQSTIARKLYNHGYVTALIGKWHLGATVNYHPMRYGFDEFYGFLHEGHTYAFPGWKGVTTLYPRQALPNGKKGVWINDNAVYSTEEGAYIPVYDANNPILRSSQPVIEEEYLTDAFTRETVDFIERKKNQPFFIEVAYNAVHTPWQAANKYMKKFEYIDDIKERIFAAMLATLDDAVGAIINKIRELGLEKNTIIIFLSDNGAPLVSRKNPNGILRGGKGEMYEGGIRVPFMMQWKGTIPPGKVYKEPVCSIDILPTVAAAVGLSFYDKIDGVNLLPFLFSDDLKQPSRNLFWRMGEQTALRSGEWKLVNNEKEKKKWELFNLKDDISEQNDLYSKEQLKAKELKVIWNELNNEMAEPIFRYNKNAFKTKE